MNKFKIYIILATGITLGAALSLKINAFAKQPKEALPIEELRTFSRVFKQIKENYVEEISDKDLINNAISGMVSSLDPHSAYMLPENFSELNINTSGKFGGLGIEVGMEDGFVKVISPIDDTPAMHAGVKAGDLIIRIDDKPVKGMTLNDAVKLMRGKIGTAIEVTIIREGADKPLKIKIIRDVIKIRSVKSKLLEPTLGYIRISQFQSKTAANLKNEIRELNKEKPLTGLILDLRNNPGGILNGAVSVSNIFLNKGKIVFTKGRNNDSESTFNATSKTEVPEDIPVIVLINGGSASASEIVAGALQDHKRALIVGTKSFGKGSVQTVMPLGKGAGLKITTARYFTPKGRSIQAEGITPDIIIKPVEVKPIDDSGIAVLGISEKDLSGHLKNPGKGNKDNSDNNKTKPDDQDTKPDEDQKNDTKGKKDEKNQESSELISRDFVLYEALNLLKGISLLKK